MVLVFQSCMWFGVLMVQLQGMLIFRFLAVIITIPFLLLFMYIISHGSNCGNQILSLMRICDHSFEKGTWHDWVTQSSTHGLQLTDRSVALQPSSFPNTPPYHLWSNMVGHSCSITV